MRQTDRDQDEWKKKLEEMRSRRGMPGRGGLDWTRIVLYFLIWLGIFYMLSLWFQPEQDAIPYTEFKEEVRQGNVAEVTFEGDRIVGLFKAEASGANSTENGDATGLIPETDGADRFRTVKPAVEDPELIDLLEDNDVVVRAESTDSGWLGLLLVSFLPWLLIIGLFVWAGRRFQRSGGMGGGGPFGFGKSKAKRYTKTESYVTFNDVAGLSNAKKELSEIVDFLKDPSKFKTLGGKLPKGVLLVGPAGVGKTLLAKAVAGEADVPFFSISGSEFIEMFVGVGASRVRDMFAKAKKESPAIIFIDELDSIGRVRGTGVGGGHDEREQTLNQILAEMDGFEPYESIVVLAATNRPDVLDPALVRPGRFDRRVTLNLPQKNARKHIFEVHTRNVPLDEDVDFEKLAKMTIGFSGADIENMVNEAALIAGRKDKQKVDRRDFEDAVDKIRLGVRREDVLREKDKELIAYHEAGHALMARWLPGADPLNKVSIIPRGRALGATEQLPEEDRQNVSRTYLKNRIAIMLGGRVAESMVFNDITSGGADDLSRCTQLARRMVGHWGMSDKIGPVTFKMGEPHPFLGKELSEPKDYSEATAELIDEEVSALIRAMEDKARKLLSENREKLDRLAHALLEHETMSNSDIDALFEREEKNN